VATVEAAVLHPRAAESTPLPRAAERSIGLLFIGSGLAVFALMGLFGLAMRLTQATVLDVSPAWFYRLMTVHGAGMLTGALLAMMGALWFVLRETVPLRSGRALTSYMFILVGAVCVIVAVLVGGFATGWTFLTPLPFHPAGQWSMWATQLFLVGLLLVGAGFFVFCTDVLATTTTTYGGLARTLGIPFLRGKDDSPPPPQAIAGAVVSIDGLLASAVGATIIVALLGRTYDASVELDPLWAKNLTYFFGHETANLIMYLAAGAVYVILPRYAGRQWKTTKPIAAAWLATLVLLVTAYSHHLYMDFVQPEWAGIISTISSSAAALPVAVVTIYSGVMLVWGSRYRWTLASTFLYLGFAGWAIGGTGAVIDSVIPLNFRFHNTDWVVAHFHTYLLLTVIFWAVAFLSHVLERDAGRSASPVATAVAAGAMVVGGYGLTGTWFVAGALGIPRRYATQPPGTSGYSLAGGIFVMIFALGFLVLLYELVSLARAGTVRSRSVSVAIMDTWTGGRHITRREREPRTVEAPLEEVEEPFRLPLATPAQLAAGVAAAVVGLASFFPQVVHASETSARYHHLDHAGQFFLGLLIGVTVGSLPAVSRWLGSRFDLGLAAVVAVPALMLLTMVPRFYEPLEAHAADHALYHVGMALLGAVVGLGTTRLGLVAARLAIVLSIGMALMFAGTAGG
jgi:cytochrome c oxidase subunit 1